MRRLIKLFYILLIFGFITCKGNKGAAEKVYVAPGEKDEVYAFLSGGYSGNLTVHGIPSGRLLKTIPVFSLFPENGYGIEEETKRRIALNHRLTASENLYEGLLNSLSIS